MLLLQLNILYIIVFDSYSLYIAILPRGGSHFASHGCVGPVVPGRVSQGRRKLSFLRNGSWPSGSAAKQALGVSTSVHVQGWVSEILSAKPSCLSFKTCLICNWSFYPVSPWGFNRGHWPAKNFWGYVLGGRILISHHWGQPWGRLNPHDNQWWSAVFDKCQFSSKPFYLESHFGMNLRSLVLEQP